MTVEERLRAMLPDDVPGIQYVVVDAEGPSFEAALGVRDVASGLPMERTTLQMAYSVTKVITALAVMKLADQGKMDLEDPLSRYFAAHPYGDEVTIRALLAHTSGVPNPMPLDWFSLEGSAFDRGEKLAALLRKHPKLVSRSGSKYAYSNLSYWLLEKAVEQASGSDYGGYVTQEILSPLSIEADDARFSFDGKRDIATGHSRRFTPMNLVAHLLSPSGYWAQPSGPWSRAARVVPHGRAYGGLFTNASALSRVLRDLLLPEPTLLNEAARDRMFEQQKTSDGKVLASTLGWVIGQVGGVRYFGKQGGGLGFHGNVRLYPDRGIATAMLANRTELSPGPIDARTDAVDALVLAGAR